MSSRLPVAVFRSVTGDLVSVGEIELEHAARHFVIPRAFLLGLIARVLAEPTVVYVDDRKQPHTYRLFYRLEDGRYLLAVVKVVDQACLFASMYPTGNKVRPPHKKFRKLMP